MHCLGFLVEATENQKKRTAIKTIFVDVYVSCLSNYCLMKHQTCSAC